MSYSINGSTPQAYGNYRAEPQVAKPAALRPSDLMQAIAASRSATVASPKLPEQERFVPKALQGEASPKSLNVFEGNQPLLDQRLQRLDIREIQAIAAQSGYVGVSPQAIQRAFIQKESLLVDYKV